jgi:hypothetical protein
MPLSVRRVPDVLHGRDAGVVLLQPSLHPIPKHSVDACEGGHELTGTCRPEYETSGAATLLVMSQVRIVRLTLLMEDC